MALLFSPTHPPHIFSFSFESSGCLKQFRGHSGAITTMATDRFKRWLLLYTNLSVVSTGRVLFTAGADSTIRSWNIQSGQCLKVAPYICFNLGLTIGHTQNICNSLLQTFQGHTRMILDIIVKPKAFYTSSTDLTVRSWVCSLM